MGETGFSLRVRSGDHRYAFERKKPLSSLFSHLSEHGESDSASVCAYIIIPIEAIPRTGFDQQDRINRLRRETFSIDTLGSIESTGINKKRAETVFGSAETNNNSGDAVLKNRQSCL